MKPLLILTAFVLAAGTAAAEKASQWDLYQMYDWSSRLDFYTNTAASTISDDFVLRSLDLSDAARIESGPESEVQIKRSLALVLIRILGDRGLQAAAPALARLPVQYKDPVLRGESWLALGKIGDRTAVPSLVRTLAGLNDSGQRTRGEEIQANYLVRALALLKAPEAFRAVAAAAQAWYTPSSGVRALAKKVLPTLVPDYDAAVDQLLSTDDDLNLLEATFQDVAAAGNAERTTRAAAAMLSPLVRIIPADQEAQDRAYRLILSALSSAQKSAAPPASLVPSLRYLLVYNRNPQLMIQSVQLLGRIADPAAVGVLSDQMRHYNTRQATQANSPRDMTLVHETIVALGLTGKAAARSPLEEGRFAGYTPAVVREIAEALGKLPSE